MRSILLIALSNLRRRRGQALLVGTILALSVLLFFAGLGLVREINAPVHQMLAVQRASQLAFSFDTRIHHPDSVRQWWLGREGVLAVTEPMATIELREATFFRGKQLSRFLYLTERPLQPTDQDSIRIIDGPVTAGPGPGEIWLPTGLAAEAGIHPGDSLEIPSADGLRPLIVSAVVVDPQFSGAFFNPIRAWIAPGELPALFQSQRLTRVMMGVRLGPTVDDRGAWNAFVQSLGGAFGGASLDREGILATYTGPYVLMAGMIVVFSALGFLVALFAIQGTITSAILADYKTIGLLRAQGFRPADIERSYQLQYLILAGLALPLGLGLGAVVVRAAIALLTRSVAMPVPVSALFGEAAIALAAFALLVWLFVVRVTRIAGRVRPADAIRYGSAAQEAKVTGGMPLSLLGRFSVPIMVAIKNMGLQKRRAAFLTVAVIFATVAAAMAVDLDYTMGRMTKRLPSFGFEAADVRITRAGRRFSMRHHEMMAALAARPEVKAVATWDGVDATFPLDSAGATRFVQGTVADGDMEGLQFQNMRGRNPQGATEMSVAIRTAIELGLDVGSKVKIFLMGSPVTLDVVGVYQSINNTGHGFRVRLEAVRQASPLWSPSEYAVALQPGVDPERFNSDLEAEYGEAVDAKAGDFFIKDQLASIMTGLRMTNGFLAFIFLAAAAVFVVNTTLLTIAENKRIFGILKATGMTPAQLRTSVVAAVGVQAGVAVTVGLALWFSTARWALSPLFSSVGLPSFPLEHWFLGLAVVVPLILGFALASAWVPSRQVLDINPRALIVE